MSPFLQLALALVVIILAAKTGGYISYRLGQPSVLGGLVAGLLLGPSLLDFFHLPLFTAEAHVGETIAELAELGVLLLMFIAGLDLRLSDLVKSGKVSALAGTLGVVTPVLLGTLTGLLFDMTLVPSVFLGLILAATSVSISAQTLMELGALRSRVGISMLGAAVFDDVLVVLGLSIFLALIGDTGAAGLGAVALVLLQMVGYLVIATVVGFYLLPDRLARRVERLPVSQSLLSFAFVTMLLYAWAAEALGGMAAITGAFLAGLIFARSPQKERIESGVMALAYGLFVPIFFVNIGLSANARELVSGNSIALMLAMTTAAILSKIIGAGLGGRLGGLTGREALQLGVGMMSRGEVGLIVVSVGVSNGLVSTNVFAAVVGVVILTTLLTPPLLRSLFARNKPGEVAAQKVSPGEAS